MKNPFTLTFGKIPENIINRDQEIDKVYTDFVSENPSSNVYLISGVRGSGKTILMSQIADKIRNEKDFIVIDLNPERDILTSIACNLSSKNDIAKIFKSAKINFSAFGLSLEINNDKKTSDISVTLDKMFESLKNKNKKVLLTIDEITSRPNIREFIAEFQIYMCKNYNVFFTCSWSNGKYHRVTK